jgi:hypothetical protein
MKKLLLAALITGLNSTSVFALDSQPGYLVFKLSRHSYQQGSKNESFSYKVALNEEFRRQLKNLSDEPLRSTGFYCGGGTPKQTVFTWWAHPVKNGKVYINMWGQGAEEVTGRSISSRNPSVSQYVTFKSWQDVDMTYQLSYVNNTADGLNVSFEVKYLPATANEISKIPFAPIRKADESVITLKDAQLARFQCGFQ